MKAVKWFVAGLGLFFGGLVAASLYFYNLGVSRRKKSFLSASSDLGDFSSTWGVDNDWLAAQTLSAVDICSTDGLRLHASYFPADQPAARTAILAHGYNSVGVHCGGLARFYHAAGWNVLMPDNRGHGNSEGNYVGFGWPDRLDYLGWIQHILDRQGQDAQIVLHGVSMGGATVLMISGEALPDAVKAVISDSAYTSAADILSYQMKRLFKLPPFPLVQMISLVCRIRAGYFFEEASALNQVRKTRLPVLLIHGEADTFVPAEMSRQLYAACPGERELFLVPGAGHALPLYIDPAGYTRTVGAFLSRCLG